MTVTTVDTASEQQNDSDRDKPRYLKYWIDRWTKNKIGFHIPHVTPSLLSCIPRLTGQPLTEEPLNDPVQFAENSKFTWFLPLCGKSVDISYLLSQGFNVFGVEAVKLALDQLEQEQNLGLVFDESTRLFTGAGGRLKIYFGDLFHCPLEQFGPFDFIWDRASFITFEYVYRQAYSDVMKRALTTQDQHFSYLMETVLYDREKYEYEGPPRNVTDEDIQTYFGSWTKTEIISKELVPHDSIFSDIPGEPCLRLMLFTPQQSAK